MHLPMKGVRILEVAQFTFTPAAGAVLADWGAEVIKVEHAVSGDAQRGIKFSGGYAFEGSFHPLMEHSNRGKRSIGLDLARPEGHHVLMELAAESDVFLTNFLPDARRKLSIEVEDIRRANPQIIYVRGSALGARGPESEQGGYDASVFWARAGSAMGCTPSNSPRLIEMPGGGYGDSMGGMTIAGGISAALFARATTGETSIIDVSLLSVGTWSMGIAVDNALLMNEVRPVKPLEDSGNIQGNPAFGYFETSDGRRVNLSMMQPGRYWADLCKHLGLDHLADDERFNTGEKLIANAAEAGAHVSQAIASRPLAHWLKSFETLEGQWAPVQNALEVGHDPQVRANGYVTSVVDFDGNERELVCSPVQFDETPPVLTRAPQFAEHTDEILRTLGYSEDAIIQLKTEWVVT
jgi:crotonobetainyl-CoA:carnitine CoA-transferase CaiB-like acyl-CoA transferase